MPAEREERETSLPVRAWHSFSHVRYPLHYRNDNFELTSREWTHASMGWEPSPWSVVGETHKTSDISGVVQTVVDRMGWAYNNSINIFINGTGTRTAESFDGGAGVAAELTINYEYDITPSPVPAYRYIWR